MSSGRYPSSEPICWRTLLRHNYLGSAACWSATTPRKWPNLNDIPLRPPSIAGANESAGLSSRNVKLCGLCDIAGESPILRIIRFGSVHSSIPNRPSSKPTHHTWDGETQPVVPDLERRSSVQEPKGFNYLITSSQTPRRLFDKPGGTQTGRLHNPLQPEGVLPPYDLFLGADGF